MTPARSWLLLVHPVWDNLNSSRATTRDSLSLFFSYTRGNFFVLFSVSAFLLLLLLLRLASEVAPDPMDCDNGRSPPPLPLVVRALNSNTIERKRMPDIDNTPHITAVANESRLLALSVCVSIRSEGAGEKKKGCAKNSNSLSLYQSLSKPKEGIWTLAKEERKEGRKEGALDPHMMLVVHSTGERLNAPFPFRIRLWDTRQLGRFLNGDDDDPHTPLLRLLLQI